MPPPFGGMESSPHGVCRPKMLTMSTAFTEFLELASNAAGAGLYFQEAGRWGMAIALQGALGGSIVVLKNSADCYVVHDRDAFDWRGRHRAPMLPADLLDSEGVVAEAAVHGVPGPQVYADHLWAREIVAAAKAMADSATFGEWFAGSCVKSAAGAPLQVFHGTAAGDLQEFRLDAEHVGNISDSDCSLGGVGFFFTPDEQAADWYANNAAEMTGRNVDDWRRTIVAHLSLKNPMVYEDLSTANRAAEEAGGGAALREKLIAGGFDGLIYGECTFFASQASSHFGLEVEEEAGYHDVVVVFHPEQIRLVRAPLDQLSLHCRPRGG